MCAVLGSVQVQGKRVACYVMHATKPAAAAASSSNSVQKAFTPRERLVISCMYVHIFRSNQFADQIINTAICRE